jgi:hypothetical protein
MFICHGHRSGIILYNKGGSCKVFREFRVVLYLGNHSIVDFQIHISGEIPSNKKLKYKKLKALADIAMTTSFFQSNLVAKLTCKVPSSPAAPTNS